MQLALPLVFPTVAELLAALGLVAGAAAGAAAVAVTIDTVKEWASNTDLPARHREYLSEDVEARTKEVNKEEEREPTPTIAPVLFERKTLQSQKTFVKVKGQPGAGEVWVMDLLHGSHYEVYSNERQFKKGTRTRAVWWDGRKKAL